MKRSLLNVAVVIALSSGVLVAPASASEVPLGGGHDVVQNRVPQWRFDSSRVSTQSARVALMWDPGFSSYEVQYSTDPTFTSAVKSVAKSAPRTVENVPTDFGVTLTELRDNTRWHVRVRAAHRADSTSTAWSPAAAVVTKSRSPLDATISSNVLPGGRVKLTWKHDGQFTTVQKLHIAATYFEGGKKGKNHKVISLSPTQRSHTLTATDLQSVGAPIGSGKEFRYRLQTTNQRDGETRTRYTYNNQVAVAGQPHTAPATGATTVTVGTYNVTSVGASGKHPWSKRKSKVASTIVKSGADIIAIQEATTTKQGSMTATKQLLDEVRKAEKKQKAKKANWKLVRATRYITPGKPGGSDGQRILYDANKYQLLSTCRDTTGKGRSAKSYSSSCVAKLPALGSSYQKFANYAQFKDKKTGKKFWVISTHFEHRKGSKYEKLRAQQSVAILKLTKTLKKTGPVILAGDLNASDKRTEDHPVLDPLTNAGYINAYTAKTKTNPQYNTANNFTRQTPSTTGHGSRIDHIYINGPRTYIHAWTNHKNGYSAADHNLVTSTLSF